MKRAVIDSTEDRITAAALVGSSTKLVAAGSVLCVMRSGILRHTFPVAVAAVDVTLNQDMRALTPRPSIDPHYLAHYLHFTGQTVLETSSKDGTTVNSIEAERLDRHPVPIPTIHVQRAIVARLDDLFTDLDDGEAALALARADLGTWRKALLKAAVTGELTADWRAVNPPTETGADLLARILTERRAKWSADQRTQRKTYVEPPSLDAADLPLLPYGWTWASVEQLGEVITGGTPPTSVAAYHYGAVPFFTPGDLDAGYHLATTRRNISQSGLDTIRPIPANSILITCIGATIGKCGLNALAGATNQQINTIVPTLSKLSEFIFYYFNSIGKNQVIRRASSTTLPILNKSAFSRIPVPVSPEREAVEIARKVADWHDLVDQASIGVAEGEKAASTLRQSILAAAFRGDLVR